MSFFSNSNGNHFFCSFMSLMEVPSREVLALGCSTPLEPSAGRRTDFAESSPQQKVHCMNCKSKLHFCRPLTMQCTDFFRCGCNGTRFCNNKANKASSCSVAPYNYEALLSVFLRKSPGRISRCPTCKFISQEFCTLCLVTRALSARVFIK